LILTCKKSEWNLALIDKNSKIIEIKSLYTPWKYTNESIAMWDMIQTNLAIKKATATVKITYMHTGNGGGRDQEFTAKTVLKNKLGTIMVKQTKDLH
jgi:hypothetical protein